MNELDPEWGWTSRFDDGTTVWVSSCDRDAAKVVARRAWSPRAQTGRVEALFDAAVAAGRHNWPALTFPENSLHAIALMRLLLWFDQRGRCAGCGRLADCLVLDHCHVTGLVRGGLCHGCNTIEAHGPADLLRGYRRQPPAFWLGWHYPGDVGNPAPDMSALSSAVLEAWLTGASEHYIEAAWGSGWLQAHLPAAAEARLGTQALKRGCTLDDEDDLYRDAW